MLKSTPVSRFTCETCAIRDSALCTGFSDEERQAFDAIASTLLIPAKQTLFREGEANAYLFSVMQGAISLSKLLADGRRQITGLRFPGEFLGLPVAEHYAYTAETLIETSVCRIQRAKLDQLLERLPNLEHRLLDLASHEIAQDQDQFVLLGCKTPTERLASLFLRLLARIGRSEDGSHSFELPIDREDLADYVGRKRETVIRALTQLRTSGVIETPTPRLIIVPDLERLKALTGDHCVVD